MSMTGRSSFGAVWVAVLAVSVGLAGTASAAAPVRGARAQSSGVVDGRGDVLLAEEGILLDEGVTVTGGDVVVQRASVGPFLSAVEAEFVAGDGVVVGGPGGVVANRVHLAPGATVSDLVTNTAWPVGTVLGQFTSELSVPVAVAYPEPVVVEPGTVDVVIDPGAWVEIEDGWFGQLLTPGVYGALSVPTG